MVENKEIKVRKKYKQRCRRKVSKKILAESKSTCNGRFVLVKFEGDKFAFGLDSPDQYYFADFPEEQRGSKEEVIKECMGQIEVMKERIRERERYMLSKYFSYIEEQYLCNGMIQSDERKIEAWQLFIDTLSE